MNKPPERIWIEEDEGCPYFYPESELAEAGSPVTEYIRADLATQRTPDPAVQALVEALSSCKDWMLSRCHVSGRDVRARIVYEQALEALAAFDKT